MQIIRAPATGKNIPSLFFHLPEHCAKLDKLGIGQKYVIKIVPRYGSFAT
jgi:hypothetical protein